MTNSSHKLAKLYGPLHLREEAEYGELVQVRHEREQEHDGQDHRQELLLVDRRKDGGQVFRYEDEVGAAEADVRDEDGRVDDASSEVAERHEGDVAVCDV